MEITLFFYNNPFIPRNMIDVIIDMFNNFHRKLLFPFLKNEIKEYKNKSAENLFEKIHVILDDSAFHFKSFKSEHNRLIIYENESVFKEAEEFEVGQVEVFINKKDTIEKPLRALLSPLLYSSKIF